MNKCVQAEDRSIHTTIRMKTNTTGAALAVLLYHTRMRQLLSFRRFLFLPEVILLSIWMILIVLIPKVRPACVNRNFHVIIKDKSID